MRRSTAQSLSARAAHLHASAERLLGIVHDASMKQELERARRDVAEAAQWLEQPNIERRLHILQIASLRSVRTPHCSRSTKAVTVIETQTLEHGRLRCSPMEPLHRVGISPSRTQLRSTHDD